jgi:uncharacterized protein (TIGR02145 family)
MKKLLFFIFANFIAINCIFSQNGVAINSNGNPADNSAMLDVSSTSQGMLIPRMTTVQRNAIPSPETSLLIFNTTTNCFEAFVSGAWYSVSCPLPCSSPVSPAAGTITPSSSQIVWSWNTVSGATGYKWATTNIYTSATDNGLNTSYTQTGLNCNTSYTLFVWAYNSCGNSSASVLTSASTSCGPTCGTQTWAATNLNAGTMVNHTTQQTLGTKYCYNDIDANCAVWGGLYNWNSTMQGAASVNCNPCGPTTGHGGVQGFCPAGYHVPSDLEWSQYRYCVENFIEPKGNTPLSTFQTTIGSCGSPTQGVGSASKMKVTPSNNPPWNGTNTSGFSALPTGLCAGAFCCQGQSDLNVQNFLWSSTQLDSGNGLGVFIEADARSGRSGNMKMYEFSVRCLKD